MIKKLYKIFVSEKKRIEVIMYLNKLKSFLYFGHTYYCSCCDHSFRKFLPKGNIKRSNAQCPYCGSLERTRLLHLFLINETQIFSQHLKVLHIAPEACISSLLKNIDIDYIDGDINPALARNTIDITDIHFPDDIFDLIICSHVLGHVPNEFQAIKELYRVLKPTGTAIFMTLINRSSYETLEDPLITTPNERVLVYGEPDLCRLHGLDFSKRLSSQGFIVVCIDYREKLSSEVLKRNRLGDGTRELIFECKKEHLTSFAGADL